MLLSLRTRLGAGTLSFPTMFHKQKIDIVKPTINNMEKRTPPLVGRTAEICGKEYGHGEVRKKEE